MDAGVDADVCVDVVADAGSADAEEVSSAERGSGVMRGRPEK